MATELDSQSDFEFRLVPVARASLGTAAALRRSLTNVDLESDTPLPPWTIGDPGGRSSAESSIGPRERQRVPAAIWLDGRVLMCGCPSCGAPLTIRLWLMLADCWRCGTSIELSEELEREARRLLRGRTEPGQRETRATSGASGGAPALPPRTAAIPPPPPLARAPLLAPPVEPQRGESSRSARWRTRRRRTRSGLAALLQQTPAWLISLILHGILLTLLALLNVPMPRNEPLILLNSVVRADLRGAGQPEIERPAEEVRFDLPVPEEIDLENPQQREALLRADQDARELRLVDDTNRQLPELAGVKSQIAAAAGRGVSLAARDPRVRVELLQREGGTTLTEAAVARGLRWLAGQQQPDGRWRLDGDQRSDAAATGLALLPFLGAGQTHLAGRYQGEVAKGLRWLMAQQKEDGDLRAQSAANTGMYAHGQCAIVLCEAYLMTGDQSLREPAQRAVDFISAAQYPDGGWRYKPLRETDPGERRGDTSVVGWQLMALQSARAAGLDVAPATLELASHFLDSVQSHGGARYAYQPDNRETPAMTAEALLSRIYLGWTEDDPGLREGAAYLVEENLPRRSSWNIYYWYYATQSLHHLGGAFWDRWNFHCRDALVGSQEQSGRHAGSWPPRGGHDGAGGRIYTTSLAVCTLEVYYRHLPIFRRIDLDEER